MDTNVRIAVIGAGWWSTYAHIPALQANPAAELVAVCDRDAEKLKAAAEAYNLARTYTDYEQMIAQEQLDGVVIATPHATHYKIAKYCLEHNLHVMLEKPMTLYAADARELVELAKSHGRELVMGYTYNFSPQVQRAREVMQSGVLGAVQYVNCVMVSRILEFLRGDQPDFGGSAFPVHGPGAVYATPSLSGGGQGHLQITHMAGLLFYVTDLRAQQVLGLMNKHGLPLDLIDVMAVQFEGGALGTVGGSGNSYGGKLDLQIHCERGSIDMDVAVGTTIIRGENGLHEQLERQPNEHDENGRFVTSANLVDVILGRAVNGAPAECGWRAVELLDAAYRSAAAGGVPVTIESLYSQRSAE